MLSEIFICADYYLLIYEIKEKIDSRTVDACVNAFEDDDCIHTQGADSAFIIADYWTKKLNCKVTFSNPSEPIFVIKKCDKFWNVLIGEKIGWIIVEDWLTIKKLNE